MIVFGKFYVQTFVAAPKKQVREEMKMGGGGGYRRRLPELMRPEMRLMKNRTRLQFMFSSSSEDLVRVKNVSLSSDDD